MNLNKSSYSPYTYMDRTQTRCEYVRVRSNAASMPHTVCLSAHVSVGEKEQLFSALMNVFPGDMEQRLYRDNVVRLSVRPLCVHYESPDRLVQPAEINMLE